jgi:hypothetical protein
MGCAAGRGTVPWGATGVLAASCGALLLGVTATVVHVLKFCCASIYMCENVKFCLCVGAYTVLHRLLLIKRSAAEWSNAILLNTVLTVHFNIAKCKCVVVKLTVCSEGYLPQRKHILHNKHSTLQSFVTRRIKDVYAWLVVMSSLTPHHKFLMWFNIFFVTRYLWR